MKNGKVWALGMCGLACFLPGASGCSDGSNSLAQGSEQQESIEAVATKQQKIGNGTVDNNRYPYVVSMQIPTSPGLGESCSGVLVSPTTVLTASHCFLEKKCNPICDNKPTSNINLSTTNFAVKFSNDAQPFCINNVASPGTFPCVMHSLNVSGAVGLKQSSATCICDYDRVVQDMAVVQLDTRVPLNLIRPVDMHLTSGRDECPTHDFTARAVGFGPTEFSWYDEGPGDYPSVGRRNSAESDGWFTRTVDGVGFMYSNFWTYTSIGSMIDWQTFVASSLINPYKGSLPGDSGGALVVTPDTNNPARDILCGTAAGHATTLSSYIVQSVLRIETRYVAVNAGEIEDFLSPFVLDSERHIRGTCFDKLPEPGAIVPPEYDTDSDGDTIPDGCDPCPDIPDITYISTGKIDPIFQADWDKDGRADVCDNCVRKENKTQMDSDGDGYGDACDTCARRDLQVCPANGCGKGNTCVSLPAIGSLPFAPFSFPGIPARSFCAFVADEDNDGISNRCDNCPGDANDAQIDIDQDGVGDRCDGDNCKGSTPNLPCCPDGMTCSTPAPLPTGETGDAFCQKMLPTLSGPTPRCVVVNSSQQGGIMGRCDRVADPDNDQLGPSCDNCATVYNPWQDNCNEVSEMVLAGSNPQIGVNILGDACDPAPCSYAHPTPATHPVTDADPVEISLDLYGVARLHEPTSFPQGFPRQSGLPNSNKLEAIVGLRHCACPSNNPPDCLSVCPVDSAEYLKHTSSDPWQQILATPLESSSPLTDEWAQVPFSYAVPPNPTTNPLNPPPAAPWYAPANDGLLVKWDLSPLLPKPYPALSEDVLYDGVLWSHVVLMQDLAAPLTAAASFAKKANHYEAGPFGVGGYPLVLAPPTLPALKIPCILCYKSCPACKNPVDVGVLSYNPANPAPFDLVFNKQGINLSSQLDPFFPTEQAASARWIQVAERDSHLKVDGPGFALMSEDGTSPLAVYGPQEGRLVNFLESRRAIPESTAPSNEPNAVTSGSDESVAEPLLPPARKDFGLTLSGLEQVLYTVGGFGDDGAVVEDLWSYIIPFKTWKKTTIDGPKPKRVLAAVFRPQDRALYVLDETPWFIGSWARLLRIDLDSAISKVLGQWPRLNLMDRFFLANTPDGSLMLTASSSKSKHYRGFLFQPSSGYTPACSFTGVGELQLEPTMTRDGLTLPLKKKGSFANEFISRSELSCKGKYGWRDCL